MILDFIVYIVFYTLNRFLCIYCTAYCEQVRIDINKDDYICVSELGHVSGNGLSPVNKLTLLMLS